MSDGHPSCGSGAILFVGTLIFGEELVIIGDLSRHVLLLSDETLGPVSKENFHVTVSVDYLK